MVNRSSLKCFLWLLGTLLSLQTAWGEGHPLLLVKTGANPFSSYYAEILRAEGLNAFDVQDISAVSDLSGYDVVILGETALTSAQAALFTNWVNNGGNLIAMRPDKQLAGLLGLISTPSTLADGYIQVSTSSEPGSGIVSQPIQFHGTADLYTAGTATAIATLYARVPRQTALSNPAVTLRTGIGTGGGSAAAFLYDLARSVVYTRQGNPDWVGQNRDGMAPPHRSDELFYGNAASDPQLDWVDLSNIAIPQADEQQRLLANLILFMNQHKKPLPRLWYFPFGKKGAVVLTGDDHAQGGTAGRFDALLAASPAGCNVDHWECYRGTSYLFTGSPLTDAQASQYSSQGFELGLHLNTNCDDYTAASLEIFLSSQLTAWASQYPSQPAPVTNRTHCIVWSDWVGMAQAELAHGIRLDTNYYYWPPGWVTTTPGFFTGSGIPMRFAQTDGTLVDVYQAATQMTDESGQSYPSTIDGLLDNAVGAAGYYGVFTANMHTDSASGQSHIDAGQIVASAASRGIPVISAKQLLHWLDGRNGTTFESVAWNNNTLSFTITPAAGANGLQGMLPLNTGTGGLGAITRNGVAVSFTVQTIKGIPYAFFPIPSGTGTYQAVYSSVAVSISPATVSLTASQSQQFTAAVTGTSNTGVSWSTSNANLGTLSSTGTYTAPTTISTTQTLSITATSTADPTKSASASVTLLNTGSATCPCSIWNSSATPSTAADSDSNAVEVGLKFSSSTAGYVTAIRFYKGVANTGTHIGHLWSSSGALLASVTFGDETTSGWQQAALSTPVAIQANTIYVVSYTAPNGHYAADTSYFQSALDSGPLHVPADGPSGGNGVYTYGSGSFPSQSYHATNYWVDLVFSSTIPGGTAPVITGVSTTAASTTAVVTWMTDGASDSRVDYGTSPSALAQHVSDAAQVTAHSATLTGLTPGTAYYYRVTSANTNGSSTYPAGGTPSSFTTASEQPENAVSIWSSSDAPAIVDASDPNGVELGVRFRSDVAGVITGVRFYKAAANTGTHIGNLWTNTGIKLGTATFASETASGWQQANFTAPIAISANTTYVVSYYAPAGHYSATSSGLANAVDHAPLHALASGADGNGVFHYGSASAFPSDTWNASNYWVDVVFVGDATPVTDTTPPVISALSAAPGSISAVITWTTDEPSSSRVDFGISAGSLNLTQSDPTLTTSHSITLSALTAGTTYFYRVTSADSSGNSAVSPASGTASFVTIDTIPPVISALTASPGPGGTAIVSWTTSKPSSSRVDYGTSASSLIHGTPDPALATAHTVTLAGLTQGATYFYQVTSADGSGNSTTAPATPASFVENAVSIWNSSAVPALVDVSDPNSVELGLRFRSDVAGVITGVRFYKAATNTGTHTGNLWTNTGTPLGTVTFTNETASGWQQANFTTPIVVSANTTYVVSYYAPSGHYSATSGGLANAVDHAPLHALTSGTDGNGVYHYGSASAFPGDTWNASNYWVDVIFVPTAP
ncbi:MAG TPA: DUF4082 domain-containing protein [Bryobacteraceae bacterium]|nr:DUF4082 domain-containing protein [Bryobacteraceae bacterium]